MNKDKFPVYVKKDRRFVGCVVDRYLLYIDGFCEHLLNYKNHIEAKGKT